MLKRILVLSLFVLLWWGCRSTTPDASTQNSLARCGGVITGFDAVVAGTENQFFTAVSRQVINIKPGIEVVPADYKQQGSVFKLTTIAKDNDISLTCACPAGCKPTEPGHVSCTMSHAPGGKTATCSGDCGTATSCCVGCGWVNPH
jgi:hypothetical protein